jgi:hypothetical protein
VLLVQSLQNWYPPPPFDELDDIPDEPDEPDDEPEDEPEDVIPDEPDADEFVEEDELDELLLDVPVPVSSEQPPSAKSAHEVIATPNRPRKSFISTVSLRARFVAHRTAYVVHSMQSRV